VAQSVVVLRRVLNVLGLVALVLAASACRVDLAVDVVVNEDGTGTVTLTATADAEVVQQASGLAQDLRFDDLEDAGWVIDGPSVTDDDGITVTISHPFSSAEEATALLATLNGEAGPFQGVRLTRVDEEEAATYSLSGAGRVDSGLAAFTDPDLLSAVGAIPYADEIAAANLSPTQAIGITFTIDLPGSIEESSADPEIDELTWTVPLDGTSVELSATSTLSYAEDATWSTVATVFLVALIAWLVIAGGVLALVVKARRRRPPRRPRSSLPGPNLPITTDIRVPRSPIDSDRL
jgi:hypothetical protein